MDQINSTSSSLPVKKKNVKAAKEVVFDDNSFRKMTDSTVTLSENYQYLW